MKLKTFLGIYRGRSTTRERHTSSLALFLLDLYHTAWGYRQVTPVTRKEPPHRINWGGLTESASGWERVVAVFGAHSDVGPAHPHFNLAVLATGRGPCGVAQSVLVAGVAH